MPETRTGYETFTMSCLKVHYDRERADRGLPPWSTEDGSQFFTDDEVQEDPR